FESDAEFAPLGDEDYDECLAQIPASVGAVAEYWRTHPLEPGERPCGERGPQLPPPRRGGRWVHSAYRARSTVCATERSVRRDALAGRRAGAQVTRFHSRE